MNEREKMMHDCNEVGVIDAQSAAHISEQAAKGPDATPYRKHVFTCIAAAAKNGRSWTLELPTLRNGVTEGQLVRIRSAILEELKELGYKVNHYVPDQRASPGDKESWTISW